MSRLAWYRVLVVGGLVALLEVLCLAGVIDKITMQAPHLIARDLFRMLVSGRMNGAIMKTLGNTALALVLALGVGIATAFVATIYGVGVANLILFPLAARLRERHLGRMRQREAVAEALVALASHETPGVILRKFAAEPGLVSHKGKALTG